MSRRAQSMPPMALEKPKRKPIVAFICFSWKIFACVFSHVALVSIVVAYCIAGALLFEHLEASNEKSVKQGIRGMRTNVTDDLWDMTTTFDYLHQDNWTKWVENRLERFERDILTAMKTKGWDGNENEQQMQWTFFGALFYSIVVITTIGYGHIAPKTDMGKVITIFYAILGIPLMLLCLSNIGDVMAGSFRFLYWRVCCYVCTREPRRSRRARQNRMSIRQPIRTRSQPPPNMRRSVRVSQKSADSGFITRSEYEQNLVHSLSDPQLRHSGRQDERNASKRSGRHRDDIRYDVHDERGRGDRRSPYNPRRSPNQDYDDDMYNERRRRRSDREDRHAGRGSRRYDDDRYYDTNDERYNNRRHIRDRSPNCEWDDRGDGDRDRGRRRDRYSERHRDNDYDDDYDDRDDNRGRSNHYRRRSDYDDPADPDEDFNNNCPRSPRVMDRSQRFSQREQTREKLRDRHTVERERNIKRPSRLDPLADLDDPPSPRRSQSVRSFRGSPKNSGPERDVSKNPPGNPSNGDSSKRSPKNRARSVDPRIQSRHSVEPDEYGVVENRYARLEDRPVRNSSRKNDRAPPSYNRSYSAPRTQNKDRRVDRLEIPETPMVGRRSRERDDFDEDFDDGLRMMPSGRGSGGGPEPAYTQPTVMAPRRERPALPPSPRIMSPMGFAIHRQAKFTKSFDDDNDLYFDDDWSSYTDQPQRNRPVPIWLCVFLVVGYIIAGAFLFSEWEHWSFLDSAYFCFITLTTIGFGDFVPAQGVKENSEVSIALCSLYLLFGISLLAMSFNLVQEEVISNVKSVARRLGILKEKEIDDG